MLRPSGAAPSPPAGCGGAQRARSCHRGERPALPPPAARRPRRRPARTKRPLRSPHANALPQRNGYADSDGVRRAGPGPGPQGTAAALGARLLPGLPGRVPAPARPPEAAADANGDTELVTILHAAPSVHHGSVMEAAASVACMFAGSTPEAAAGRAGQQRRRTCAGCGRTRSAMLRWPARQA